MKSECDIVCLPFEEGRAVRLFKVADKYVGLWLLGAMVLGLAVGHLVPGASESIARATFGDKNLLLIIGLMLMLYPPLARVRYEKVDQLSKQNRRLLLLSVSQNWLLGPVVMFVIAALFFSDRPEFMTGLILLGLMRCISSVIVWNELAEGDSHYCAGLAGTNLLFQFLLLPVYAYLFITVLPDLVGLGGIVLDAPMDRLMMSELVYLVIPLAAGMATRFVGIQRMGELRYEAQFVPLIRPISLLAKMFAVFVLFSLQGGLIVDLTIDALYVALPLALYYLIMFGISYALSVKAGASYEQSATLAFTASSSNFELAIVLSIAVFGISSGQAFVAVIGPMVEVPVVITLVYVALWLKRRLFRHRIECVGTATSRHYRACD
jgi:arsenite transporter